MCCPTVIEKLPVVDAEKGKVRACFEMRAFHNELGVAADLLVLCIAVAPVDRP